MVASLCLLFSLSTILWYVLRDVVLEDVFGETIHPKQSMYGIFTYIYRKNQPNVGKCTLHGWYGYVFVQDRCPKRRCKKSSNFIHSKPWEDQQKYQSLAVLCDLFGMVKWFQGLSDLQLRDRKVALNHPVLCISWSLYLLFVVFLLLMIRWLGLLE